MALGAPEPGSLEARYADLAGDYIEKGLTYAARFYLHFSVDEWRALPWWQKRLYTEGLMGHQPWMATPTYQVDPEKSPTMDEPFKKPPEAQEELGGDLDELAGMGFNVTRP